MLTSADLARRVRIDCVQMTSLGGSSHVASCLSVADILAVLYAEVLHIDPKNPSMVGRDRLYLSKGHAGAAVYAVLAESGFFDRASLAAHYADGSVLSGHVSSTGVPGVEWNTGSLGHGLPVAVGAALGARMHGRNERCVVVMSDGDCDEGSVWEAALFAGHHKLTNVMAVIDYNQVQSLATTDKTLTLEPFGDKWRSFGWSVSEVDGHNHSELSAAFQRSSTQPTVVIAHTKKGKGVPMMEADPVLWHYRTPQKHELAQALAALNPTGDDLDLLALGAQGDRGSFAPYPTGCWAVTHA